VGIAAVPQNSTLLLRQSVLAKTDLEFSEKKFELSRSGDRL
jgi:hypothetical protein